MTDSSTQADELLLELYDRLDSSLLRYLHEATPWADPRHADLLVRLLEYGVDQEQSLQIIADLVFRRHLLPDASGWPNEFATLHYLSLQFVIEGLTTDQRDLVEIASELSNAWPDEASRDTLESVRTREAARLEDLIGIQSAFTKIPI